MMCILCSRRHRRVVAWRARARSGTLHALVRKRGCLPPDEARVIFAGAVAGAGAVAAAGLAHRDIKLENVLLFGAPPAYRVALSDFGMACLTSPPSHEECGSFGYMAPERVMVPAAGYDPGPSDVWSLAVCLWVMVTGAFPFRGIRLVDGQRVVVGVVVVAVAVVVCLCVCVCGGGGGGGGVGRHRLCRYLRV